MGKWIKKTALEWAEVFKAQAGSGVTAAGFCREQGISYKQFLYFRKKVRQAKRSLAVATSSTGSPLGQDGRFIPVAVQMGCAMRVRFPRGLTVESDGILPASWVVETAERWLRMGE